MSSDDKSPKSIAPGASKLTAVEVEILSGLDRCLCQFLELDDHDPDDFGSYVDAINSAKRSVLVRVARRCNPGVVV